MSNILREMAQQALEFMKSQECQHENTHRGGAIWEVCDDCGAKWADDRGGKPNYREPKAITDLRTALALPDDKAQPVAWISYNVLTGKTTYAKLPVQSLQLGVYRHTPLYAAQHASDCAMHNEPAYPAGECDCGVTLKSVYAAPQPPAEQDRIFGPDAGRPARARGGAA